MKTSNHASLLSLLALALLGGESVVATSIRPKTVAKNAELLTKTRREKEEDKIVDGDDQSSAPVGSAAAYSHAPTYAPQLPVPSPSPIMPVDTSKPTISLTSMATAKETSTPTLASTVLTQTKLSTGEPTLSPTTTKQTLLPTNTLGSLSATTGTPTLSPTLLVTTAPTALPTSAPTSLRSKGPAEAPTQHPTATQTVSPSTVGTIQTDVEGDNRYDKPPKPKKEDSVDDSISHDGGPISHESVSLEPYSLGCDAIARGETYTEGIPLAFDFKYQIVYDGTKDLAAVVQSLEKKVQHYLEKALIHCEDSIRVIPIEYFTIDGVHADLALTDQDEPESCGTSEQFPSGICAVLDGSIKLYLSERIETSTLQSKQDALKVLMKGMEEDGDLLDDEEGILILSFIGGVGDIEEIAGGNEVPASARIDVYPQNEDTSNEISGFGKFLIFVAVATTLALMVTIRTKRKSIKKWRRTKMRSRKIKPRLSVVIEEEEEEEEGTGDKPDDDDDNVIEGKLSVVESFRDAFVASTSVFGCSSSIAESIAEEINEENNDDASSVMDDAGLNTHSIDIHQYCTSPTCTICRSWKKPMFTDLKYNVVKEVEPEELSHSEEAPVCLPRGIATALDVSKANCYLCSA